jgi:hypothetical protein
VCPDGSCAGPGYLLLECPPIGPGGRTSPTYRKGGKAGRRGRTNPILRRGGTPTKKYAHGGSHGNGNHCPTGLQLMADGSCHPVGGGIYQAGGQAVQGHCAPGLHVAADGSCQPVGS